MGKGRSPRDIPDDQYNEDAYADGANDEQFDSSYANGYSDYNAAYDNHSNGSNGALMPMSEAGLPALAQQPLTAPTLIPGSGVSMGTPFIKRRERPLAMRLATLTLMASLLVTGLFAVTPLGSSAEGGANNAFQALSGAVVWHTTPTFHWYTAQYGDSIDSIATQFNVQIGGILELNNMIVGQEIQVGKAYKIPDDPYYGKNYRPSNPYPTSGNGSTFFGTYDWFTAYGGTPLPEQLCAPNGGSNPRGYDLQSPNWGSHWVRGFTWYHNGDDISAPNGNPIHAAQAGVVIWAGWSNSGFGYSIMISHCYGLVTLYGHLSVVQVKEGQPVTAGQVIGLEGSTGASTGPHLHFSVLIHGYPDFQDPMLYYASIAALTTKPAGA